MNQQRDSLTHSGGVVLRSSSRRCLLFALPLLVLTVISLATTWQKPHALLPLLLFGLFIGAPFIWWAIAHQIELTAERVRHRIPLAPVREVALADLELVDLRPSDRRWPCPVYVVTLATRQGDYLPFETANFTSPDLRAFLDDLMARAPHASYTDRAVTLLTSGL